ncbi:MAG TPA: FtsX-like permease family protein, partial [Thermoanaerobaculia bacterium]
RGALVVAEVALSFTLLIGAGLLGRSFSHLLSVDKGFDADGVITAHLVLPASRYPEKHQQRAFFAAAQERLAALPGVKYAAFVNDLPLVGGTNGTVVIDGRTFPQGEEPMSEKRIVTPGYFEALRIKVVDGRAFTDRDRPGAPLVVIVNQAFVRRFFPGERALGKRVDFAWETNGLQEIVGVVADVREQSLSEPAAPAMYVPLAQRPEARMSLVVRAAGEPRPLVPRLREAVYAVDRNLPLADVRTLGDIVALALAGRTIALSLFGAFSALALILAAVGLYAVVSYSVAQRQREIGIRMALGAHPVEVTRSVLVQGLLLIAAGAFVGALAALGFGRFLAGLVFGVGTSDPATFGGVALVLAATALFASLVPALRASRVDPARVLGAE